jgi:hypothetical protein
MVLVLGAREREETRRGNRYLGLLLEFTVKLYNIGKAYFLRRVRRIIYLYENM